jgi:biopolymer transport protein ExbD
MRRMRAVLVAVLLTAACKSKPAHEAPPAAGSGSAQLEVASEPVQLPEVSGQGYDKASAKPDLTVTTSAFVVDDKPVGTIADGGAMLSELGGSDGMAVQPVVRALAARTKPERFTIALDKRVAFRALLQALATARAAQAKHFAVLARHGDDTVGLPLDPIEVAEPEAPTTPKQLGAIDVRSATVSPPASVAGDTVKSKVTESYIGGLRRCLKLAARPDAPAHESVELGFTIDETGHTADASAYGTALEATSCLTEAMKAWQFPIPKDNELVPTTVTAKVMIDVAFDALPGAVPVAPPPVEAIGITVAVSPAEITVFSSSGLEGTAAAPKLRVPLGPQGIKDLEHTLLDIVQRRWAGKERDAATKQITVTADAVMPLGAVMEVLGVVRRTADGAELFPQLQLGVRQ